ncbi:MAG: secondary thiamine-phosphate synthase enzyme YjbQ [Planctomycetota bacterium]|jgi:secondary thiamine-phosphate synthase enzyme
MRFHGCEIPLTTERRFQILDITDRVSEAVSGSGVRDGFALVYSPHTTAAIRVNELDRRLHDDMEAFLHRLVHPDGPSRHNLETVDDRPNAWGHLVSLLMNASASIPVHDGALEMGGWQSIFFIELDGPRESRKALVRIMGE